MSIGPLKQRSSWPSSLLTGLIGWNGFFIILALAFGDTGSAGTLFILASAAALAQVIVLRLLFFNLRLERGVAAAVFWGGLSGALAVIVEMRATDIFANHPVIWLSNAIYIGIAVGLFLRYFYRDDRRIESEAIKNDQRLDYGRDAHWLEPFVFGAVGYLIAFVPRSSNLAATVLIIGAMSGVIAAGVSHFLIFTTSRRSLLPILLGVVAGAAQGALSGLLFRPFAAELLLSPLVQGAVAGILTYLMTTTRGRALAREESGAEFR